MTDTINNWPFSFYRIFIGVFFGTLTMLMTSIMSPSGNILSASLATLFLSYVIWTMSQVNSMDIIKKTDDIHAVGAFIQFGVIVIVLLSIPPTMMEEGNDSEKDSGNTEESGKGSDVGVWGHSSRMQSGFMLVMVLILTHVLSLWVHSESMSTNLFWYRLGEGVLTVILYQYALYREGASTQDPDDDDDDY